MSSDPTEFQDLNVGYNNVFRAGELSVGLVVPIENYESSPLPSMNRHIERVQLAEALGFSAVWIRDVPFNVPSFGDAGQTFDPFVYSGVLAACTKRIALGFASVILPLRHPAHVAKAAATVDVLSSGRLLLGVASGDRPEEYPAHGITFADRGERFRSSFEYIERMSCDWPCIESQCGILAGQMDMLPKPTAGKLPMLVTGSSQQGPDWLAKHGDGRMLYPRPAATQAKAIHEWRSQLQRLGRKNRPILEPLYIDLVDDPDAKPTALHLGYRLGSRSLVEYLESRNSIGVNHVALNLRFNKANVEATLEQLADIVLPRFSPK